MMQRKRTISRWRVGVLVVLAGATMVSGQAELNTATRPAVPTDGPKVRVEQWVYDFGEVYDGQKVEHEFVLHNDGRRPLVLSSVRTSCGCTAAEYDRRIAPGDSGKIKVVFNTHGKGPNARSYVYVSTNDPANRRLRFTLQGTVRKYIEVEPSSGANFGRVVDNRVEPKTIKLTSHLPDPLKLSLVPGPADDFFDARITEIEPGKVFEIAITPKLPLPEGATAVRMRFDTGIPGRAHIVIPCRIYVPPAVEVSPSAIVLAGPPVREAPRVLDVAFNKPGQFRILAATCSDPRVRIEVGELVPGRRWRVVCMIPEGFKLPARQAADITILTDCAEQPRIHVPLRMRTTRLHGPAPRATAASLVGQRAPGFSLPATTGPDRAVQPGFGDVVVLDFWSVQCPHSARQLPIVQRLADRFAERGVQFVLISIDADTPADAVAARAKALGVNLPTLLDEQAEAYLRYHQPDLPALILVGRGGTIEAVHIGVPSGAARLRGWERSIAAELELLASGKRLKGSSADAQARSGTGMSQPGAPPIGLVMTTPHLEMGLYRPGAPVRMQIPYRNPATVDRHVTAITASPGVTVHAGYATVVKPHASGSAIIEFSAPKRAGAFARHVLVTADDGSGATHVVTVTGTVRPYFELSPPYGADFSRDPRTHAMPRTVTLIYNGQGPVHYTHVESSSPKFTATIEPTGTTRAKLTIRAHPPFDLGENQAVIRITTDNPDHPTVEVPVTLYNPPRIEVTPAEITLSPTTWPQRGGVVIRNNGDRPLHILSVTASNDALTARTYLLSDGLSYLLIVSVPPDFQPVSGGDQVVVRTDDPDYSEIIVPIHVVSQPATRTGS